MVECVRPWRGWSLPGGSVLAQLDGVRLAGRPVGGGKRTRTQPHVLDLEDLTTDVAVLFSFV